MVDVRRGRGKCATRRRRHCRSCRAAEQVAGVRVEDGYELLRLYREVLHDNTTSYERQY